MNIEKNLFVPGNYYIGLDVGTNSVGMAVTDFRYRLLRSKGKSMWFTVLFNEADTAKERGNHRRNRRRLQRRHERLLLLRSLFAKEINKVDPYFFHRLDASFLQEDDKPDGVGSFTLFNDKNFSDSDYYKKYPTIYHLRKDLIESKEPKDIRLVFLALSHLVKNRGHFLFNSGSISIDQPLSEVFNNLSVYLENTYGIPFTPANQAAFIKVLQDSSIGKKNKSKLLREYYSSESPEEINYLYICDLLAGAKVKLSDLYGETSLKEAEIKSISLLDDFDSIFDSLSVVLEDRIDDIVAIKEIFDRFRVAQILGEHKYICDVKVDLYNKNKEDINLLKNYVRTYCKEKYNDIFIVRKDKVNNFVAYNSSKTSHSDFCKYIQKTLLELKECDIPEYQALYKSLENETFFTRLKGKDNGIIPHELLFNEVEAILDNVSVYLPFLNKKDDKNLSVKDKIKYIFNYKIPYYVGPLNLKSERAWVVRTDEKIYPWNFDEVVDKMKSSEQFMERLIGRCTYTGLPVLPKDSLLYSEFMLLNEINNIKINGHAIPVNVKKQLIVDLFENNNKKVRIKDIKEYFLSLGLVQASDEITGVDNTIKSKLKSYQDFKKILEKTHDTVMVEDIILQILVCGDDKSLLKKKIRDKYPVLSNNDISYIARLKYKDWGRLSGKFLTEVYHQENGENVSIIEYMRNSTYNLMQLLSSDFQFKENADKLKKELVGDKTSLKDRLDDIYISPSVRRSINITLKMVNEVVKTLNSVPNKIFIEVTRKDEWDKKGKTTKSRKDILLDLYEECRKNEKDFYSKFVKEYHDDVLSMPESEFKRDKLYLYYTQLGKCMYSGDPIDLEDALKSNNKWDIDHIFPRSRISDDSINNKVLVKASLNRDKSNEYPLSESIRTSERKQWWKYLKEKGFISEAKYDRLVRNTPLTDEELHSFIARQLVETRQSTVALATLLKEEYEKYGCKVVYSKANNVSRFRQQQRLDMDGNQKTSGECGDKEIARQDPLFVKVREINDLHHAKDAYLNIVVGNVYDTKFTDKFFSAKSNYSINRVFDFNVKGAWNTDGSSIATVRKIMARNDVVFKRVPYEVKGALFKVTPLSRGKGQHPLKNDLVIAKYGGYTEVAGAYFFAVEHSITKGKINKRIRTIEYVSVMDTTLYEKDPVVYCVEKLGLKDPVIISKRILKDSLLEINGVRFHLSSRSKDYLKFKNASQLYVPSDLSAYIKKIQKYVEFCKKSKSEIEPTIFDGVNKDENMNLYLWFVEKFASFPYNQIYNNSNEFFTDSLGRFNELSVLNQCIILLEILKHFSTNISKINLSLIGGPKEKGAIQFSKIISNLASVYLIHQSATGLIEKRINLLK